MPRFSRFRAGMVIGMIGVLCSTGIMCPPEPPPPPAAPVPFDPLPADPSTFGNYQTRSKWQKSNLTFFIANTSNDFSSDQQRQIIRQAFDTWAAVTPLVFTEVTTASQADLVVGFGRGGHCDLYQLAGSSCSAQAQFDGPGNMLAHCYYPPPVGGPTPGDCHFDDDEGFSADPTGRSGVPLLAVAVHELGHGLGLDHNPNDINAIMYPSYNPSNVKTTLGSDDIAGIQALYGARNGTSPPATPQQPPTNPPQNPGTPQLPPGSQDSDGDGIDDQTEIFYTGTNPNDPDTDDDGLSDYYELYAGLNPLNPDTDGDGKTDGQEIAMGTDPYRPDGGATPGGSIAGTYYGSDSFGSAFVVTIAPNGTANAVLSFYQFGYPTNVPFFGAANAAGAIQLVSYDYFFAYYGQALGSGISGQFQTAAGAFGTWQAVKSGSGGHAKIADPAIDSCLYQPAPDQRIAPTHPVFQRVDWTKQ